MLVDTILGFRAIESVHHSEVSSSLSINNDLSAWFITHSITCSCCTLTTPQIELGCMAFHEIAQNGMYYASCFLVKTPCILYLWWSYVHGECATQTFCVRVREGIHILASYPILLARALNNAILTSNVAVHIAV